MNNVLTGLESWRSGKPAGGNLLCVSWLKGQFKAVAFHKGSVSDKWEAPEAITDFAGLSALLREAADRTRTESRQVALVLAHPRLNDQIVELPPAKGLAMERFLQRRVGEIKTFSGEAAWSRQPALPLKGVNAALLHLFPTSLLNQLTRVCQDADLQLVRVLPSTAVLAAQLRELSLAKDQAALLVAETGPDITLVVGRNDGRLCLGRMLGGGWGQGPEAVAVELTRTIGFAEQQAGVTVSGAWLFGTDAPARAAALQPLLKRPVHASPVPATPFYWAEQAGRLPERDDGNLISRDVREAPQRRLRLTVTTASLLLLLLVSLATAGYVESLRRADLRMITRLNGQIDKQKLLLADLTRQFADAGREQDFIRLVSEDRLPPVPAWFAGYLSDTLPEDLVLTRSGVVRTTNDCWSIRLEGQAQPASDKDLGAALDRAFAALTNRLVTGPFHMTITRSAVGPAPWNIQPAVDKNSPLASATRPALSAAPGASGRQNSFVIEGIIR